MPNSNRLIAVLCALCVAMLTSTGACDDLAFSISPGQVTVVKGGSLVRIANGREAPIFFFVVERETAAVINWAPCTDPEICPRVDPGEIGVLESIWRTSQNSLWQRRFPLTIHTVPPCMGRWSRPKVDSGWRDCA